MNATKESEVMEIVDNSLLNNKLERFGLYVDDFQNINFISNKKYHIESMLNTHGDAQSIINISYNIIGWLTEKKIYSSVFFKLSLISCLFCENNFIVTKLLTPGGEQYLKNLIKKLNSEDKYFDAYQFTMVSNTREEEIYEKLLLQDIINYLLVQEEHGSFVSISNNHFRLVSIQDGLISITSNDYTAIGNNKINQLLTPDDVEYKEWLPH